MTTTLESVSRFEGASVDPEETEMPVGYLGPELTPEDVDDCGWHIRAAMVSAMLTTRDEYDAQSTRLLADRMAIELQCLDGRELVVRYHQLLRTSSEAPRLVSNWDEDLVGSFIEPAMVEAMHFILPDGEEDRWPEKAELMRKCMIDELQQIDCQKLVDQFMQIQAEYPEATGISRI